MKIKKIILIVLAVLIIVGSLGVMIRFSVPATKKPNKDNVDNSQLPTEEPADVTEFYDFAQPMEWENIGANYYTDLATVYLKSGDFIDNNGTFDFFVTKEQINVAYASNLDPYVVLGNSYVLDDYSKIVYEVDVKVSEDYPFQIVIRPDYRQGWEESSPQASVSSGIVCFSKGVFYVKDTYEELYSIDKDEYHFTYVVNSDNTCQVYVDGKLIYETNYAYAYDCYMIKGLRLSAQYGYYEAIDGTATASFDNIQVKGYLAEAN